MQMVKQPDPIVGKVAATLVNFTRWLERYGETSWDHQSYYSGLYGGLAKRLYYRSKLAGMVAVAPMVFSEGFVPTARRLFHHKIRLPIADAHYAMGFAFLHEATGEAAHLEKAAHFLDVLEKTRCPDYQEYGWGYPFDWVTRFMTIKRGTPLITTTPYVFEAFLQVHRLRPDAHREKVLKSIVRHVLTDIKDFKYSAHANTCSYTPNDEGKIVNASAYRAGLLVTAAKFFNEDELLKTASLNVNFVLETQKPDGSWPYAVDGTRDFVDHFHTCFVMKALAKIYLATGDRRIRDALDNGLNYYLKNLFGPDGMPRPFSKAPRLTVYECELYDCAEAINLCLLLRREFPYLETTLEKVVNGVLKNWVKRDGSFRSRKLKSGWDNVPMHRWAQSQMFRALAYYLREINVRL
ncbi:MAG TPA: hypothetical protein VG347_11720 [Verrucomicrobiae bacterium]|nr:hypothetical protein [Verrucomicrobiae bacterium]